MEKNPMRSFFRLLLVAAALVLALVVGAACGSKPAPAAPTQAPVSAQATAPQAVAPQATQPAANPPTASVQQDSQDAGPSLAKNPAAANTRHYQGDPNAPVVLIEISDFQ
jgi:protein-disulfide isomerase